MNLMRTSLTRGVNCSRYTVHTTCSSFLQFAAAEVKSTNGGSQNCREPIVPVARIPLTPRQSIGNGQVSLILVCLVFALFRLRLYLKEKKDDERKKKIGTPKLRDTWPFPSQSANHLHCVNNCHP